MNSSLRPALLLLLAGCRPDQPASTPAAPQAPPAASAASALHPDADPTADVATAATRVPLTYAELELPAQL